MSSMSPQAPSPSPEPLPLSWIERLFRRLEGLYGRSWAAQWDGLPREEVQAVWAAELAGYAADELRAGVDACRRRPYPPTLPEFLLACRPRPALSCEALFQHAATQWQRRASGGDDWYSPAVYWAAVELGGDLARGSWRDLRGRWEAALLQAERDMASGRLPDGIPEAARALPGRRAGQTCAVDGCTQPGSVARTTGGGGPWFCARHV